jgi:hypothetical protein
MWSGHLSTCKTALPLHRSRSYSGTTARGRKMLAPPAGSMPLLRWAQGHCQYPADQVPPRTSSDLRKDAGRAATCCRVSHGTGPGRPVREGSGGAMCLRLRTPSPPPLCSGGLRCHHVSRDPAWAVNKEILQHNRCAAGLTRYRGMPTCYRGTCKTYRQTVLS